MTKLFRFPSILPPKERICTIGTFDGFHRGHVALIEEMRRIGKKKDFASTIVSFYPHPREVVATINSIPPVMSVRERLAELEKLQVETLYFVHFTKKLMSMGPEEFFDRILDNCLNCKYLLVGPDLFIGRNREGTPEKMKQLAEEKGWEFSIVSPVEHQEGAGKIGTRHIRELLGRGDLNGANALLGKPYRLSGKVVRGDQRGRTIGCPTANIHTNFKLPLPYGVYAAKAEVNGLQLDAVVNIGKRPTFHKQNITVEAHFLKTPAIDCYEMRCTLHFIEYIRSEQKFDGIEALQAQIKIDIQKVEEIFNQCT